MGLLSIDSVWTLPTPSSRSNTPAVTALSSLRYNAGSRIQRNPYPLPGRRPTISCRALTQHGTVLSSPQTPHRLCSPQTRHREIPLDLRFGPIPHRGRRLAPNYPWTRGSRAFRRQFRPTRTAAGWGRPRSPPLRQMPAPNQRPLPGKRCECVAVSPAGNRRRLWVDPSERTATHAWSRDRFEAQQHTSHDQPRRPPPRRAAKITVRQQD